MMSQWVDLGRVFVMYKLSSFSFGKRGGGGELSSPDDTRDSQRPIPVRIFGVISAKRDIRGFRDDTAPRSNSYV